MKLPHITVLSEVKCLYTDESFIFPCSDGDRNIAHDPDIFNPEWLVQTPPTDIVTQQGLSVSYCVDEFALLHYLVVCVLTCEGEHIR